MEKTQAQKVWPQRIFSELMGKVGVSLMLVMIFAIVQALRYGFSGNDHFFLLLGSLISMVAVFAYTMAGYVYGATGRKSFLAMLCATAGFIPWAFGSYLVFYKGFWGLVELRNGFSILIIVGSIFFILLGYFIVKDFYKITEVEREFMKMAKEKGLIPAQSNNEG